MSEVARLTPASILTAAERKGRWGVAPARRAFIALLVGLVWIGPAWWDLRFLYALAAWDALVALAWYRDLKRLPPTDRLEISRTWFTPLAQGDPATVALRVRNRSQVALEVSLQDDLPSSWLPLAGTVPNDVQHPVIPSAARNLALEIGGMSDSSSAAHRNRTAGGQHPAGRVEPFIDVAMPRFVLAVRPGRTASVEYSIQPTERGDISVIGVYVRYRSAWQLAERWAFADLHQTVRVYPSLQQSKRQALYLVRSRQVEMEKRLERRRGMGREFESLREYRQGDEMRDICWTATARRGKLIIKTYRSERSQSVMIVLDTGRLMLARVEPGTGVRDSGFGNKETVGFPNHGWRTPSQGFSPNPESRTSNPGLSKLDCAVTAAFSLAQVALETGDSVGLLAYGRQWESRLPPTRGRAHLQALLNQLSVTRGSLVEADHAAAASALLARHRRRCLMVWLTDLAETAATPEVIEAASRLLPRHAVLFIAIAQPDLAELAARRPASPAEMYRYVAAQEMTHRRELLLRRLRQQGALVLELRPEQLAAALVNQYLEVKERGLL